MKVLVAGVFNVIYKVTGSKPVSFVLALIYVTVCNLVIVYGIGLLFKELVSLAGLILVLFSFPIIIVTTLAMAGFVFWAMPSWDSIAKEGKKVRAYTPLVMYTAIGLLVFFYSRFYDKIF
ncbi:MAG: hypothetical protein V4649_04225 [Bacteroidota bacterium]